MDEDKNSLKTKSKGTIIAITYVVFYAILILFAKVSVVVGIFYIICIPCGWRALNRIQPAMFIWMPLMGWILYLFIKLILSCLVGLFVAPYVIRKGNL